MRMKTCISGRCCVQCLPEARKQGSLSGKRENMSSQRGTKERQPSLSGEREEAQK